jgi:hypothetical protein
MTRNRRVGTQLLLGVLLLIPLTVFAAPRDDSKKKGDAPTKEQAMEAMLKYATPGPEHKRLDDLAGTFTYTMKAWMEPGQPPNESTGTSESKWILGGRYLSQDVTGNFAGMPFYGHGLIGYDNAQKKYISVWVDSFGTGVSHGVGTADAGGKVITYFREDFDPFAGQRVKSKDVVRIVDKDHHEMDMFKILPDGKELKVMELRYTRKK